MADYKTDYSNGKNINTLNKGSYNDFGDGTPAKQILLNKINKFSPSKDVDAITVEYPANNVEVYIYRVGGLTGAIESSITVTYNTSAKKDLVSVVVA
jgi:hypothetical protein